MKLTITKWFALMTVLSLLSFSAYGQDAEIKGKIIDSETQEPLVAASVAIVGTTMGAATNTDGDYVIRNVPPGVYRLRASFVGYAPQEKTVNVGTDGTTADFEMKSTSIEYTEVIVEVNRARERETPVAFTTADKEEIEQRMHGQDAPLLLK
ncbi:MAG: carboxypeptidase-like regulatory domain-containing protein, partial [Ignavibacteriae bacterium]|nr:carboxypeptidase-like regulatory domain-containing protein [Ignavibacteriota bacterium]